eukprot:m.20806 g.20806  ORF g.20806 m.20806 type:complete len:63 (+) comp8209_c0_seq1:931-1119(+)
MDTLHIVCTYELMCMYQHETVSMIIVMIIVFSTLFPSPHTANLVFYGVPLHLCDVTLTSKVK